MRAVLVVEAAADNDPVLPDPVLDVLTDAVAATVVPAGTTLPAVLTGRPPVCVLPVSCTASATSARFAAGAVAGRVGMNPWEPWLTAPRNVCCACGLWLGEGVTGRVIVTCWIGSYHGEEVGGVDVNGGAESVARARRWAGQTDRPSSTSDPLPGP